MSSKTIISCDLCQTDSGVKEGVSVPCAFVTEQTEGRNVKPYLATVRIDICGECL